MCVAFLKQVMFSIFRQKGKFAVSFFLPWMTACSLNSSVDVNSNESAYEDVRKIAEMMNVDESDLKHSFESTRDNYDSVVAEEVDQQEKSCIADYQRDGVLNLGDVADLSFQVGKTCAQIAREAIENESIPDDVRCFNLSLDRDGVVDLEDLAIFIVLMRDESLQYDYRKCSDPMFGDGDGVSVDQELMAFVHLNPLDPDTLKTGRGDLQEYQRILSSGNPSSSPLPFVQGVSGDSRENSTMELLGEYFGQHTLDVEWTKEWIETQAEGTNPANKANWKHLFSDNAPVDKVSTLRAWSGSKSIRTKTDAADKTCGAFGCFSSTLTYEHPQPFQRIYASWWMHTSFPKVGTTSNVQWKFFRLNSGKNLPNLLYTGDPNQPEVITGVDNPQGEIYWPMYVSPNRSYTYSFLAPHCETSCSGSTIQRPCMERGSPVNYEIGGGSSNPPLGYDYWWPAVTRGNQSGSYFQEFAPTQGEWVRVEFYGNSGTEGNPDGEFRLSVFKPGVGLKTGFHWENLMFFSTRDCRNQWEPWQALIFQNMFDDNGGSATGESAEIFFDDYYIQIGTQARIEIGNDPVYENCTMRELQEPVSWSEGRIQFKVNYGGSFSANDLVYVFVVRDDGAVSPGYSMILR